MSSSFPTDPCYWCYHCDKRVYVDNDTLTCSECNHGFVEAIQTTTTLSPTAHELNSNFLRVLRLLAEGDHDVPPPPPPPVENDRDEGDYLRIQMETGEDDVDDEDGVDNNNSRNREVLRLRLQDLAASRRNRILDWAEILMGLDDHSINLRLQTDGSDGFTADPEDYLDAAGYEALLRDLAEIDTRRGAPPASQEAVLSLENLEIKSGDESVNCAVCKDEVGLGDVGKKLPCGHVYHEDCIIPWLGSRNTCPVCRYELETDDLEYEAERRRRDVGPSSSSSG